MSGRWYAGQSSMSSITPVRMCALVFLADSDMLRLRADGLLPPLLSSGLSGSGGGLLGVLELPDELELAAPLEELRRERALLLPSPDRALALGGGMVLPFPVGAFPAMGHAWHGGDPHAGACVSLVPGARARGQSGWRGAQRWGPTGRCAPPSPAGVSSRMGGRSGRGLLELLKLAAGFPIWDAGTGGGATFLVDMADILGDRAGGVLAFFIIHLKCVFCRSTS